MRRVVVPLDPWVSAASRGRSAASAGRVVQGVPRGARLGLGGLFLQDARPASPQTANITAPTTPIALTGSVRGEILLADRVTGRSPAPAGHSGNCRMKALTSVLGVAVLWLAFNATAEPSQPVNTTGSAGAAPAAGGATGSSATGSPGAGSPATPTAVSRGGNASVATPSARPAPRSAPVAPSAAAESDRYLLRLRELEARVEELKERIRRSHARLSLLSESVLGAGIGGARAEIQLQNEMSSAFRVTRVLVLLDGVVQYNREDQRGELAERREIPVFNGALEPGDHTVQVSVHLRGHGYGVFSYLRGYSFDLKQERSFSVPTGKTIELSAVVWEKGDATTPLEERPALRFTQKLAADGATAAPKQGAPAGAGGK